MNNCAPNKQYENGSCLTINDLIDITKEYNNRHNDTKKISKNKKILLNQVNTIMNKKYKCDDNDQLCWINTNLVDNLPHVKENTFRPVGPKGKYEWLSTSDINDVMNQYEYLHKDFKFYGAIPYDFDILPELDIYNINYNDLIKNNKTRFGMVVNLDTHDQSGSHWVALYCDLNKNRIYYFDSFAKKPGKRLKNFVRNTLTHMYNKKYNTNLTTQKFLSRIIDSDDFDVRFNKKQHQFKNSECGVYSMNFIIRLLNGETFDEVQDDIMKDDKMNSCRDVYFRKE
jgi:hypothetical protein